MELIRLKLFLPERMKMGYDYVVFIPGQIISFSPQNLYNIYTMDIRRTVIL